MYTRARGSNVVCDDGARFGDAVAAVSGGRRRRAHGPGFACRGPSSEEQREGDARMSELTTADQGSTDDEPDLEDAQLPNDDEEEAEPPPDDYSAAAEDPDAEEEASK